MEAPKTEKRTHIRKQILDRIPISEMARARLDAWCEQVTKSRPGVKIGRRDLVEWVISRHSEVLTPTEQKELADSHYDDLKFLHFAFRELRAAKARGEEVSLKDVIDRAAQLPERPRGPRKRSPKEPEMVQPSESAGISTQPPDCKEGESAL